MNNTSAFSYLLAGTVLIVGSLDVTMVHATTWYVERDGSGDFVAIPEAIAASSPGDSILIGPGRFTETVDFVFAGTTSTDVHVPVSVDSLTIIGSGKGVTIIGPTEQAFTQHGPKGITAPLGITRLIAVGMTIENLRHGAFLTGTSDVVDMVVQDCELGIWEFTTDSIVRDSEFRMNDTGVNTSTGCSRLRIENCEFFDNDGGIRVNSTDDVVIKDSNFSDSSPTTTAIQYAQNSTGFVEGCSIVGAGDGIAILAGSDVTLHQNLLGALYAGLYVADNSTLRGSSNVVRGRNAAIAMLSSSVAFFDDNHILKTDGLAVWCSGYVVQPVDIDLRNNYWGTDNADSIAAWIFDGNDPQDPPWQENLSNVSYEPFSPVPVEAEEQSTGSLKSLFRRR